jgi:hypothetical protein
MSLILNREHVFSKYLVLYKNNKLGSRSDQCLEWRYDQAHTLMHVYVLLSDRPVCVVPVQVNAAGRQVLPSQFAPSFKVYSYTYSNNTCTLTFWRCSQESGVKAKSDDVHAGNPTLEQSEAEESVLSKPSLWNFQLRGLPILSWFLWGSGSAQVVRPVWHVGGWVSSEAWGWGGSRAWAITPGRPG